MDSKSYVKLAKGFLMLPSSVTGSVHNSRTNQLYIYKTYKTCLPDSVHNSRKNQLYTSLACENRPSCFYVLLFLCNVRSNVLKFKFMMNPI